MSPADQQLDDVKADLDRYSTRARNQAEETYQEGKEKGRGVWGNIQNFFGKLELLFTITADRLQGQVA